MDKIARLIVSFNCGRDCPYCCNKYTSIVDKGIEIKDMKPLVGYDKICVTGGEPMLCLDKTIKCIKQLKEANPKAVIYLYSAKYVKGMESVIKLVDGIHFTLHINSTAKDIEDFNAVQELFKNYDKSFRLYINPNIKQAVSIVPNVWKRVEVKDWIEENDCQLPTNETLFILEG